MANTNINIRMDTDLKKQFEEFCADMGMTMTTAFNILRERLSESIEYHLKLVERYRMMTLRRLWRTQKKGLV